MKKSFLLIIISLFSFTNIAFAHGVKVEISFKDNLVIVKSSYSKKSNLVNAQIKIYSPLDTENEWQTGQTDKTGHFVFRPDVEGEWTFIVDDLKGHKKKTIINYQIEKNLEDDSKAIESEAEEVVEVNNETVKASDNELTKIHKIIIGLSIIFGISGIFYGIKSNKK